MVKTSFNLKQARVHRGYSRLSLANELSVSITTITAWEKRPDRVPIGQALKILAILDMPISIFRVKPV